MGLSRVMMTTCQIKGHPLDYHRRIDTSGYVFSIGILRCNALKHHHNAIMPQKMYLAQVCQLGKIHKSRSMLDRRLS